MLPTHYSLAGPLQHANPLPTRDFDLLDSLGRVVGDVDIDTEGLSMVVQLLRGKSAKFIL